MSFTNTMKSNQLNAKTKTINKIEMNIIGELKKKVEEKQMYNNNNKKTSFLHLFSLFHLSLSLCASPAHY